MLEKETGVISYELKPLLHNEIVCDEFASSSGKVTNVTRSDSSP